MKCVTAPLGTLLWAFAMTGMPLYGALIGPAFTYQGQFKQGGVPPSGINTADFQFTLWDAPGSGNPPSGGIQLGSPNILTALVKNGLFTVQLNTVGEFGPDAFNGEARWLQVSIRYPAGVGNFVTLSPRQPITPAPVALSLPGITVENGDLRTDGAIAASAYASNSPLVFEAPMGTERARINDLTGNFGIGNSAPQALLHVGGAYSPTVGGMLALFAGSLSAKDGLIADGGEILSRSPAAARAAVVILDAEPSTGGHTWSLVSHANNSPYQAPAGSFTVYDSATSANRLTIGPAGDLKIGISGPGDSLKIGGANIPMGLTTEVGGDTPLLNLDVNFRHSDKNTAFPGGALRIDARSSPGAPLLQFLTRPAGTSTESTTMAITDSGRVSIGTTNPFWDARLFVLGTGNYAVAGVSDQASGVGGNSNHPDRPGVYGQNLFGGMGVEGWSQGGGEGVYAVSFGPGGAGVYASGSGGASAGYFSGNVSVNGTLSKTAGSFRIDHPLNPENKYLYHSFVESPDMKNIYDGVAVLDDHGEARIDLPEWFGALNSDFRYQLTAIGAAAPNLHVADEINQNTFRIAGGPPGLKVSWMVTGIRQDAYARAHRIPIEEDKPVGERGTYLHPVEHGHPETMQTDYARLRRSPGEFEQNLNVVPDSQRK